VRNSQEFEERLSNAPRKRKRRTRRKRRRKKKRVWGLAGSWCSAGP